jgi:hypothetical protein
MARRGKCRCGAILSFQKTKQGYKTRCPACQSVVRLRVDGPRAAEAPHPQAAALAAMPAPIDFAALQETSVGAGQAPDLSVLTQNESTAPPALAEIPVFREPPRPVSVWWFVGVALVVIAAIGAAVALWG